LQGFGNVGYYAANFFHEAGAKVICIAEYDGFVYHEDGLDIGKLKEHQELTGSILNFGAAQKSVGGAAEGLKALEMECDVLIPAALEQQITRHNAPNIKAKVRRWLYLLLFEVTSKAPAAVLFFSLFSSLLFSFFSRSCFFLPS
jgi:glutamate dehydrogenase (NAD(P)+)